MTTIAIVLVGWVACSFVVAAMWAVLRGLEKRAGPD